MGIPRNSPCPCGSGKKYKNCCFQKNFIEVPAGRKKVKFAMPGQEDITEQITNMDSIPTHNKNGIKPNITKYQMIDLCLDEIYSILKNEKVNMLVDLVNLVVHDMDIVPNFTYREIGTQIENDNRFSIYKMQICSLSGTDPLELMVDKFS
jgi:hypothetical protein